MFPNEIQTRNAYLRFQHDAGKKLRDLGAVPSDLIDRYQDFSSKQIYKKLDDANRHLKKYGHVNKKVFELIHHFRYNF